MWDDGRARGWGSREVEGSKNTTCWGHGVFRRTFRGSCRLSKDFQRVLGLFEGRSGVLGSFEALVWGHRVWRSLSKDTLEPRSLLTGVLGSEFFAYF